jgi:hypothetical protein
LRLVSCPTVIPLQEPDCENALPQNNNSATRVNVID